MTSVWDTISASRGVVRCALWPTMQERDIISCMQCNRASYDRMYDDFLIKTPLPEECILKYRKSGRKLPRITHLIVTKPFEHIDLPPWRNLIDLTRLSFRGNFNVRMMTGFLPQSIKYLSLGTYDWTAVYNQPITVGVIPESLTHLEFGAVYSQDIMPDCLPPSLTRLKLGGGFDQRLSANILPSSLTHLYLGDVFNQQVQAGDLPCFITDLTFSNAYNKPICINSLPRNLQYLRFGDDFNQEISPDILPSSLIALKFGDRYNQIIRPAVLPLSLARLCLGNDFNRPFLIDVLPSSITHLMLGGEYNHLLTTAVLPFGLTTLEFEGGDDIMYNHPLPELPASLSRLRLSSRYVFPFKYPLPRALAQLMLSFKSFQSTPRHYWPSSLSHLLLKFEFEHQPLPALTNSLTYLALDCVFDRQIELGMIPSSLIELIFGCHFNQPILAGSLPSSLKRIVFGEKFNQPLIDILPSSLTQLVLGIEFKQLITVESLPPSVISVKQMHNGHEVFPSFKITDEALERFWPNWHAHRDSLLEPEESRGEWYSLQLL